MPIRLKQISRFTTVSVKSFPLIRTMEIFAQSLFRAVLILFFSFSFLPLPQPVFAESAVGSRVLKVAAILGVSGSSAIHSDNIRKGLLLAKEDLEKSGWKIELAIEDDETLPAKSVTAARSLISRGYRFFIGPSWNFQVEAVAAVYSKSNVLAFAPAVYSAVAGGSHPHVLYGTAPAEGKIAPIAQWLTERKVKTVAIVCSIGAWGDVHREVFKEAAKKAGTAVIYVDTFEYGSELSFFSAATTRFKKLKPDAILFTGTDKAAGILVRKAAEHHLKSMILGTNPLEEAVLQNLIAINPDTPELFSITIPIDRQFSEKYEKRFGTAAGIYSDSAYDGLMLLAEAIEKTDGSPREVEELIRSPLSYEGVSGAFKYDAKGDPHKGRYIVRHLNILQAQPAP